MTAVLFTCAGQRVDIVTAFGRAGATTIATDVDQLAPALYYADRRGGQAVVTLEERIDEQLSRFPELAGLRDADLGMAKAVEADVFAGIALRPEDLA